MIFVHLKYFRVLFPTYQISLPGDKQHIHFLSNGILFPHLFFEITSGANEDYNEACTKVRNPCSGSIGCSVWLEGVFLLSCCHFNYLEHMMSLQYFLSCDIRSAVQRVTSAAASVLQVPIGFWRNLYLNKKIGYIKTMYFC